MQNWHRSEDEDTKYNGCTKLHLACCGYREHLEDVQVWLHHVADYGAFDKQHKLAFLYTIENSYWETGKLLIQHGFDVDNINYGRSTTLPAAKMVIWKQFNSCLNIHQ
jgi:hypothetical protein